MSFPVVFSRLLFFPVTLLACSIAHSHEPHQHNYEPSDEWKKFSDGNVQVGKSHGEIDVDSQGNIYVSIMSNEASEGGIKIFSSKGEPIGEVRNAPDDFHGFIIRKDANGEEYIYGTSLKTAKIIKMKLNGDVVQVIDVKASVPEDYQRHNPKKPQNPSIRLTGIDVDKDGIIYVVDGYGLDFIHKFSPAGKYLASFGGRGAPYLFHNCHKIHIDPRFKPNRLICTDRKKGRLIHMNLDGAIVGEYVVGLRRPSSIDFYHDIAAVAEISGRVSLIDKTGKIVSTLGTNDIKEEINTNKTAPEKWRDGVFTAPHGITYDHEGNLFVTEWNKYGRILKFDLKKIITTGSFRTQRLGINSDSL